MAKLATGQLVSASNHGRRAPNRTLRAAAVRLLREELQLLQEPGSYVGEVVKVMGKKKVLVKVRAHSMLLPVTHN